MAHTHAHTHTQSHAHFSPFVFHPGYREGFLWKRGRDNGQFLSRKFILSEREGALKYFNKQDVSQMISLRLKIFEKILQQPNGLPLFCEGPRPQSGDENWDPQCHLPAGENRQPLRPADHLPERQQHKKHLCLPQRCEGIRHTGEFTTQPWHSQAGCSFCSLVHVASALKRIWGMLLSGMICPQQLYASSVKNRPNRTESQAAENVLQLHP